MRNSVTQELKTLTEAHSVGWLARTRGCGVLLKLIRKYFGTRGASVSYLEEHELLCLYSLLDVANHTGGI